MVFTVTFILFPAVRPDVRCRVRPGRLGAAEEERGQKLGAGRSYSVLQTYDIALYVCIIYIYIHII